MVTRGFCSSVVFKYKIRLFVLPKRRPGQCSFIFLVEYALRLIQTYGNKLCSALGGWLESTSFARAAKGKERGKPRAEPSAKLNVVAKR